MGWDRANVFPERDKPSSEMTGELHDTVDVQVILSAPIAVGKRATVHLKGFDPDHAFNPTTQAEVNARLDPDDRVFDGIPDPEAEDNILAGVFSRPALQPPPGFAGLGGTFVVGTLEFLPGSVVEIGRFQITARQPGNNFIAVAHQRLEFLAALAFSDDGVTLRVAGGLGPAAGNQTGILTVWRTLHLELDGMKKPTSLEELLFDPMGDDVIPPADIAAPPWSLVAAEFPAANVVVADDLSVYESPKQKAAFTHCFGEFGHTNDSETAANALGKSIRNVDSENDFWVIQLISGYEYVKLSDIDDEVAPDTNTEGWAVGWAIKNGNDGPTFVFSEVMRDVHANSPLIDPAFGQAEWHARISLHEVSHRFDMRHNDPGGIGDEGPLDLINVNLAAPGTSQAFTLRQLAEFRPREGLADKERLVQFSLALLMAIVAADNDLIAIESTGQF